MSTGDRSAEAWLATVAPNEEAHLRTRPSHTIIPDRRDHSASRAAEMLAQLAERGRPMELRTGKVIGEGGMGIVREAEQVALGRIVAIKTLKPGRPEAAPDLLREAWVTGALEHPNIVPVHHLEIDDKLSPLLVLKRVDGVEWSKLIRDGAAVQAQFGAADLIAWNLRILDQVLNALRFAHARGVIHRDLKPSNVMIGHFGEVYLLDWGIAVSLTEDAHGRFPLARDADQIAGTPCYMAPEMLRREGDAEISVRTDVYLAGAVLFELIAGRVPHAGTSAVEIMSSIIMSRPQLPADVPIELAAICMKALSSDPGQRHASIEELQLALAGYLEHRGSASIAANAQARLTELVELAAKRAPAHRDELYGLLGVVRFAFHEALATWRDNPEANAGLARGAIAVAEYELACGDPRAAVTLLSELPRDVGRELLVKAEAASARLGELARIGRERDPTIASFTRKVTVAIGILFTLAPIVGALRPEVSITPYPRQLAWAGTMLAIFSVLAHFARGRPLSPINRHVFAGIQFIFAAQIIGVFGAWMTDIPPAFNQAFNMFMWGAVFGGFAMAIDRFLLVPACGYFAAFLFAMKFPDQRFWAMSASNFAMAILLGYRWRDLEQETTK